MKRERLKLSDEHVIRKQRKKSVCTLKVIKRICKLIERGLPLDGALDYLSINNSTFYRWQRLGERYLEGDDPKSEYAIYGQLVKRLRKSLATYRLNVVDRLQMPGNNAWRREMSILERRDRDNFSRRPPQGGTVEEMDKDERFL